MSTIKQREAAQQPGAPETLRVRKRRETRERIVAEAFDLFIRNGFERTSVDMIAEAAGIARRTLFHYFPSKEDIVYADYREYELMMDAAAEDLDSSMSPLAAVEAILVRVSACYDGTNSIEIDRVIRSDATLMKRRHVYYDQCESAMFAVLSHHWSMPTLVPVLHAAAVSGVSLLRMADDQWSAERGHLPLRHYIHQGFAALRRATEPLLAYESVGFGTASHSSRSATARGSNGRMRS